MSCRLACRAVPIGLGPWRGPERRTKVVARRRFAHVFLLARSWMRAARCGPCSHGLWIAACRSVWKGWPSEIQARAYGVSSSYLPPSARLTASFLLLSDGPHRTRSTRGMPGCSLVRAQPECEVSGQSVTGQTLCQNPGASDIACRL